MKIKLADGTELTATLNGNNYIVKGDKTSKITAETVKTLMVDGETFENMALDSVRYEEKQTWFVVHKKTPEELQKEVDAAEIASLKAQLEDANIATAELSELVGTLMTA